MAALYALLLRRGSLRNRHRCLGHYIIPDGRAVRFLKFPDVALEVIILPGCCLVRAVARVQRFVRRL